MHHALESGDHDTALAEAERLLSLVPDDGEARAIVARCREADEQVLLADLGGPAAVFSAEASGHLRRAPARDDRTSVLVRMTRSGLTLGDIPEMCGSLRVEALRGLDELVRMGVVRPG